MNRQSIQKRFCQWMFSIVWLFAFRNSAAPFENLGFDDAHASNLPVGTYPISQLLPAWSLLQGSTPVTHLDFDNPGSLSSTIATLVSSQYDPIIGHIEGPYGLYVVSGDSTQPFSLEQTGDVPANAEILSYNFRYSSFKVTMNGQILRPINVSILSDGETGVGFSPVSATASFDVSMFAGQHVELKLTQIPTFPQFAGEASFIDSLSFQTIPEPGSTTLFILGFIALSLGGWFPLARAERRGASCFELGPEVRSRSSLPSRNLSVWGFSVFTHQKRQRMRPD